MLWVDLKYLKMISYRLDGFSEKKINELYNVRCPLCGDSQKNLRKKRGFFYVRHSNLNYSCHNCGASMSFGTFLKTFDGNLHRSYLLDKFNKDSSAPINEPPHPKDDNERDTNILSKLKSADELTPDHSVYQYLLQRKIPRDRWSDIYYVKNFVTWAKKHVPEKFPSDVIKDHARIVIPWRDHNGEVTAYSARALGNEDPKYYTIPLKENKGFYGLDKVDLSKRHYVVEGAIDSMFIRNCIAVGTSALWKFNGTSDTVYIPDKDVRNKEVMKIVKRMIASGLSVCMLPVDGTGKDINEMIKSGVDQNEIMKLIDDNTYQGPAAELKFGSWCKLPQRSLVYESD